MPITAKDIAKDLKLTQPTVSRILNGDPNHRVSPQTKQLVLETARRLGYKPNAVARSLRRGRTGIIGFYSSHNYDARNDFQGTVVGTLQRSCEARHLDVMLHSTIQGHSPDEMHAKLRDGRIDGLILHATPDDPLIKILQTCSLPVVAVADPLETISAVAVDDGGGMRLLLDYLWERGIRRYVFVRPSLPMVSVEHRRIVFEQFLAERGVSKECRAIHEVAWEEGNFGLDRCLASGEQTAVCCWNDRTAYNVLQECLERGIRVPEQIAVVGFDGFLATKVPARRLVTVTCPWEEVVSTALQLLLKKVEEKLPLPNAKPTQIILPVTLSSGDTA